MDKLTFTCDIRNKANADFFITYDRNNWNWNDYGYYTSYLIYATPKITPNRKEILMGWVQIIDKHQKTGVHNWCKKN